MSEEAAFKEAINQINTDLLLKRLCLPFDKDGFDWPEEEAQKAIESYKSFLLDAALKKTDRPDDRLTDVVWHSHMLFSRMYHEDCDRIFGYYLHHDPDLQFDLP